MKDAGQQMALFGAGKVWQDTIVSRLRQFCAARRQATNPTFRFEEFRAWADEIGTPQPPTPNAYGAVPAIAAREGLIAFTGQYETAKSKKTRSHPVKIWRAL